MGAFIGRGHDRGFRALAKVAIAGPKGTRMLPVEYLVTGYLETALGAGELLTHVEIPALGTRGAAYLKCTTRSADDWPALEAETAVVLFDPPRLFYERERALWTPRPQELLAVRKTTGSDGKVWYRVSIPMRPSRSIKPSAELPIILSSPNRSRR